MPRPRLRFAGTTSECQASAIGDDFRAELIAAVEWIVEGPEVWPISVDDPRARRYLLSRFPYSIVYVVAVDGGITVAAVAHTKRKPGYWLRRV